MATQSLQKLTSLWMFHNRSSDCVYASCSQLRYECYHSYIFTAKALPPSFFLILEPTCTLTLTFVQSHFCSPLPRYALKKSASAVLKCKHNADENTRCVHLFVHMSAICSSRHTETSSMNVKSVAQVHSLARASMRLYSDRLNVTVTGWLPVYSPHISSVPVNQNTTQKNTAGCCWILSPTPTPTPSSKLHRVWKKNENISGYNKKKTVLSLPQRHTSRQTTCRYK